MDFSNIGNMFLFNITADGTLNNGIDPVIANWGSFQIRYYGLFAFIGFTVAIALILIKLHWWYKVPIDPFIYFAFIAIPCSLLGARIWSFMIGDAKFDEGTNLSERIVQFLTGNSADGSKSGGLAIQGGVILTTIVGLIYFPLVLKKPKYQIRTMKDGVEYVKPISTFVYADVIIPCILVGQLIGRWGNFFNGELYGARVNDGSLDWLGKVMPGVYKGMYDADKDTSGYYQPLFLYESFADFWLFLFLYVAIEFIPTHKAGDISAGYFIGYGIIRLIMEPLRDEQFRFTSTYVICGLQIFFGIAFILYNHLWLCKHRDIKYFYTFWVKFSYRFKVLWGLMNKSYRFKLEQRDPEASNYGLSHKPQFIRKPNEIFYYKGH